MSTTHYCQQAVLLLLRKIYQEWMSWRSPQLEWISCLYLRNQSHCLVVKWKLSINWACMNAYKAVFHQSLDFSVRLSPISNSVLQIKVWKIQSFTGQVDLCISSGSLNISVISQPQWLKFRMQTFWALCYLYFQSDETLQEVITKFLH